MKLIRTIRERQQAARKSQVQELANETITVKDFDNSLYIAYNSTPLIKIDEGWTSREILDRLSVIRGNFINSRMRDRGVRMSLF